MKTFRIARSWALIIYITGCLIIAFFSFLLFLPCYDPSLPPSIMWLTGPLSLGMIGWMAIALLDTRWGRVQLEGDTLHRHSIFGSRSLHRSDIRDYRIDNNFLTIYPRNRQQHKKIKISVYTDGLDELVDWLAAPAREQNRS